MSQPSDPQQPACQWDQPPISEVSSQSWTAPAAGGYAPPPPYAPPPYGNEPYAPPPYGLQAYGSRPGPGAPAQSWVYPTTEWQFDAPGPTAPGRRKLPWILSAVAAVLVLGAGGVSYAAYAKLNGGGTQPDAAAPASAIAFVKLDLNPSAAQKIAASRFLSKLPHSAGRFSSNGDWRQGLFDSLAQNSDFPQNVDFNRDVKPWLGKRMAIAALPALDASNSDEDPGAADPEPLLILQSTDDGKARAGIARFDPNAGVDFYKGYAIVGESQQIADAALADAKTESLAASPQYRADMSTVGSLGIASGWLNLSVLGKGHAGSSAAGFAGDLTGRIAFTLRFSGNAADLIAKTSGTASGPKAAVGDAAAALGALPSSTAAAVNLSIAPGSIDRAWTRLDQGFNAGFGGGTGQDLPGLLERQFDLSLPTDLDTLLGRNLTLVLDGDSLVDQDAVPSVGIITKGDGVAAGKILKKVLSAPALLAAGIPFVYQSSNTGLIAATNQDYLAELGQASGPPLGTLASFHNALPELAGASSAGFVNLDVITDAMRQGGASTEDIKFASAFSAIGFTATPDGTFHLRVLAH